MKLNPNFIRHTIDEMTLVVPVSGSEFHGLVQGNKTVNAILEYLENDTTEEEIVKSMCERFDGDPALISADVHDVITQLKGIGAIYD